MTARGSHWRPGSRDRRDRLWYRQATAWYVRVADAPAQGVGTGRLIAPAGDARNKWARDAGKRGHRADDWRFSQGGHGLTPLPTHRKRSATPVLSDAGLKSADQAWHRYERSFRCEGAGTVTVSGAVQPQRRYAGSPHHNRVPADHGFEQPAPPRHNKSWYDGSSAFLIVEAAGLFRDAIIRSMIRTFRLGQLPGYVRGVEVNGRVHEVKLEQGSNTCRDNELGEDEVPNWRLVLSEWNARCPMI